MQQRMVGFHIDEEGHWVADLACGHCQHVRHNPPWVNRPWVLQESGRLQHLGQSLSCLKCDMPVIPVDALLVSCSEPLDHKELSTQYSGTLQNNSDHWVEVAVTEGELIYQSLTGNVQGYVIDRDFSAVIEPGSRYALRSKGTVLFTLQYYQLGRSD